MKKALIIFTICLLTNTTIAQITFIKHYGNNSGEGNSLIINSIGNYIVAGRKFQPTNMDQFCIYELDVYGDTLWVNNYGTDSLDRAKQIIQTIDGGYATIGNSTGYYSNYRSIFFVKTSSTGTASWTKQIGGQGRENGTAIVQTVSGEYFIGGASSYNSNGLLDFYLVKTDANGDTLWTKKYGGFLNEESNSMRQTTDGGFILSGYSESFSFGNKDIYLVKINSIGDTVWTKHYGGNLDDISESVRQTNDGGYIMTGSTQSFGYAYDNMYVVKTDSIGDTLWTKTYGQVGRFSWGKDIIQTTDGGYAITGLIRTQNISCYITYIVKIDVSGNVQWEKEFIIDPSTTSLRCSEGSSIHQTSDGGFAISGEFSAGGTDELLLIKTDGNGSVGLNELQTNSNFTVFPNPFNQSTTLQFDNIQNEKYILTLYNIDGRIVRTISNTTSDKIEIKRDNLQSGLYFFQLQSNNELRATGKIIVE